jgi:hypothetical protein
MATKKHRPPTVIKGIEYVGMGTLAAMAGKNQMSLRRLIATNKLPESNYRMPSSNDVAGKRLYTLKLAKIVAEILSKEVRQGVPTSDATVLKLAELFKQEKAGTL